MTIGMSCMNFLEHLFLHVSHSLVVRILANGAGGLGSNPGGVTLAQEWKDNGNLVLEWCGKMSGGNQIYLIICSQKCHLNLLKFQ
jgi:hypothetical protein